MSIIRAIALQNATDTAVATTCGVGTVYDLGAVEDGQTMYAAQHLLSSSALGSNTIQFKIYSSSSSGAGFASAGETLRFTFTANACRAAEWGTPVTGAFGTCQKFWRTQWATSCAAVRKALIVVSRTCT